MQTHVSPEGGTVGPRFLFFTAWPSSASSPSSSTASPFPSAPSSSSTPSPGSPFPLPLPPTFPLPLPPPLRFLGAIEKRAPRGRHVRTHWARWKTCLPRAGVQGVAEATTAHAAKAMKKAALIFCFMPGRVWNCSLCVSMVASLCSFFSVFFCPVVLFKLLCYLFLLCLLCCPPDPLSDSTATSNQEEEGRKGAERSWCLRSRCKKNRVFPIYWDETPSLAGYTKNWSTRAPWDEHDKTSRLCDFGDFQPPRDSPFERSKKGSCWPAPK